MSKVDLWTSFLYTSHRDIHTHACNTHTRIHTNCAWMLVASLGWVYSKDRIVHQLLTEWPPGLVISWASWVEPQAFLVSWLVWASLPHLPNLISPWSMTQVCDATSNRSLPSREQPRVIMAVTCNVGYGLLGPHWPATLTELPRSQHWSLYFLSCAV